MKPANLILPAVTLLMVTACTAYVPKNFWYQPGHAVLPKRAVEKLEAKHAYTAHSIFFPSAGGTRLHGLLLTRPHAKLTIVFYGGANFQIGTTGFERAQQLESFGTDIFLFDNRGYGESRGQSTLETLRADALDVYDFVHSDTAVSGTRIVVHGCSLGSFIAPFVAMRRPVAALVLESTATNVPDLVNSQIPWYYKPFINVRIAKPLLKQSNVKRLQTYTGSLLILGGSDDRNTPAYLAKKLYTRAATPATKRDLYITHGAHHCGILDNADARVAYRTFLARIRK